MLVQLRRVVYLLVLLHCCACVVNAESVKEGEALQEQLTEGKVENMITEVSSLMITARKMSDNIENETAKCSGTTKDVLSVVEEATELAKEVDEDGKKMEGTGELTEMQEKLKSVRDDVIVKAGEAKKAALYTKARALQCRTMAQELIKKSEYLSELIQDGTRPDGDHVVESIVDKKKQIEETISQVNDHSTELKKVADAATQEAEEADKASEAATQMAHVLKEKMEKLDPTKRPAADVEKDAQEESIQGKEEQEPAKNVPVEDETKGGSSNAETTTKENQEGEPSRDIEAPKQENSDTTDHNTIIDSQQTEATDQKSQIFPSGFSDSSSSPALVHSPLLVLVLLCVLGCTGVF